MVASETCQPDLEPDRIRHASHHHTGDKWCIYPLYDWILENLNLPRPLPHQYEFAKLIPNFTIVSKRKLIQLVSERLVNGWDDPRLPTISGIRRRGVPASALRAFAIGVGVTKYNCVTDHALFEHAIRDDLNRRALRRLAVLRPLKVVIDNYPETQVELLETMNNSEDPGAGTRQVPFSRVLYIEQDDFREVPPPKYYRLSPGVEVRLRYAYLITCTGVVKDPHTGAVTEVHATYDPATRGGNTPDGRKVKATLHGVSAAHAVDAEARLCDKLFTVPDLDAEGDFKKHLNPHSLEIVIGKCEPSLAAAIPAERYQFERLGYFALDLDSQPGKPVFNRVVTLKDTWAKVEKNPRHGNRH